jgi:polyhydroxyalkanoate synthase
MREYLWKLATEPLPGVRAHHMRRVWLMGMQILRATSPSNFAGMNPEVMREIEATGGRCLLKGARLFRDDLDVLVREGSLAKRMVHKLGTDIAASPGSVVFRNDLIELIQYAPSTDEVRREPILIVPAWIMKYYILDLAPENSLIRYLVSEGFTVFCISWRNPDADDRELCLEDYRRQGVMAAIDAVCDIVPDHRIHGVGYCLGGTMLAVAAAAMRRDGDDRLATMSLLAAQTDFAEAGELMMFTDESQISTLEDVMAVQGYLDAAQMSGAFYYLRANDLVWSRLVDRYLKGIDREVTDFDAWFTDPTRMPARMHSQYLRWLFLENRLAQGNYEADGEPVALKDIDLPVFALGAERDHIAPWRSVHKIGLFTGGETHFLLSGGGHNSAVVSPPGKPKAYYRQRTIGGCDFYIDPDNWVEEAAMESGSWWPVWRDWLSQRSEPAPIPARPIETDRILCDAPGTYVHQR